jgi:hypothetical protein
MENSKLCEEMTAFRRRIKIFTSFEAFTAVMIQVVVFLAVRPCGVVGYQSFGGPCCLHLQGDGGSKDLRNFGILPQQYKASQPRRPRFGSPYLITDVGKCVLI